jgi:uncharacterized protein YyaL (SSP411 family)
MNRLKDESSPYLLQHKNNPVDWFSWSDEALKLARTEDRPILLSIGYSACHWCHVMEHESFEDMEVAKFMNNNFVNIKVDREERPDIDNVYMEALQNMGIRGGWPLNVFLLPTGEPFYGGTYFPKTKWLEVMKGITQVFSERREEVMVSGRSFVKSLNIKDSEKYNFGKISDSSSYTKVEMDLLAEKIAADFDTQDGGVNRSPKFPMPSVWNMVHHLAHLTNNPYLKEHLEFTLGRIVLGGIFDHLGGGWTRYSTDSYWKVPHFEKMLYDNGQLMSLYSKVAQGSKSIDLFKWAVNLTFSWLKTDMDEPNGGIYAAQDADSEGEEGKFYVWKLEEVEKVLGDDAKLFIAEYGIVPEGNWEHENNILHLEHFPLEWEKIKESHEKLLKVRESRVYPGLDNKVITSWNALMISGLIDRDKTFETDFDFAKDKLDFVNDKLTSLYQNVDGDEARGVFHQEGKRRIPGFLDDYAALIQANVDMYTVAFDENYLQIAEQLTKYVLANFYDAEEGLLYYTDVEAERLVARKKELFDNVIPSSNSMMAKSLYFLGRYTANDEYLTLAKQMFSKMKPLTLQDPQWLSNWTDLGVLLSQPQIEVVVTGPHFLEWIKNLRKEVLSPAVLFFGAGSASNLSIFKDRFTDTTVGYVCEDYTCHLPTSTVEATLKLIKN